MLPPIPWFIGSPAMNLIEASAVPHLPGTGHAGHVGIRPEDLTVSADGPIDMHVTAVEELGAQRLVHGRTGDARITITLPSDAALSDRMRLSYRPGALHLFARDSGKRMD